MSNEKTVFSAFTGGGGDIKNLATQTPEFGFEDADSVALDEKVKKYMEENSCTYEAALIEVAAYE